MSESAIDRARGTILGMALGAPESAGGEGDLGLAFAEALATHAIHGPARLIRELSRVLEAWGTEGNAVGARRLTSQEAARRLGAGAPLSRVALSWSKESGSEVRGALAGVVFLDRPALLREVSAMLAGLTHGHPTAAATAALIADWTGKASAGLPPERWPRRAPAGADGIAVLELRETMRPIQRAVEATTDREAMALLGEGWISDEAAAMALAALLRHPDRFEDASACAVDHDGDRAAVGRIVGALAGARHGASALPDARASRLANRDRLIRLADALVAARLELGGKS